MNTKETRTYRYDGEGRVLDEVIFREELPSCAFLRLTDLSEEQVGHLVAIRDSFLAANKESA